ncbi:hypothetical protein ABE444_10840 [Brevundimonas pondensis]|uniref:hypothetical protein n=1 Tax=Brevundimonas pondensis TaxID=2774189 RepID=UPI00320A64A5
MIELDARIARLRAKENALRNQMFDLVVEPGCEEKMRYLELKTQKALDERLMLVKQRGRYSRWPRALKKLLGRIGPK